MILFLASTQNIQIQAIPPVLILQENDLTIVCSITNPSQIPYVLSIHLLKNYSSTFETVVSINTGQTPPIQWKDSSLQVRASVTGNIDPREIAYLRFIIAKNSLNCHDDLTMYICQMSALSASDIVTQETSPITISYIGMHCKLILFHEYIF